MKYTFQHFLDISTSASSLNILSVKAGGQYVLNRCKHLFATYKYFKLGRISVKLLPASTLPVDPLMLSQDPDDPLTVSPEDQMNPGLVRITNGENLFTDLTGVSTDAQDQMYINTMLDPRWSKFMLQAGFQRSAIPLFWDIGMTGQDQFPTAHREVPEFSESAISGELCQLACRKSGEAVRSVHALKCPSMIQLGHRMKMGWLPTDGFQDTAVPNPEGSSATERGVPVTSRIPSVDAITIVLPRARKTIYYYRLFITETVYFSGIKNVGVDVNIGDYANEYRAIDNFNHIMAPTPVTPSTGCTELLKYPYEKRS